MRLTEFIDNAYDPDGDGSSFLSVTLDLRLSTDGRSSAPVVFNAAVAEMTEKHSDAQRTFGETIEMVEQAIDEAIAEGHTGLAVLASAENPTEPRILDLPIHCRNDFRVTTRPWLFELERVAYFTARPIVSVFASRGEIDLMRVVFGEVDAHEEEDRATYATRNVQGRQNVEGRAAGATGGSWQGGHSRSSVDRSIEEHRAAAAREAAGMIEGMAQPDDIVVVTGPTEPRSELLAEIPDALRASLREQDEGFGDDRERLEWSLHLAEQLQVDEADTMAATVLSGGYGSQAARGKAEIDRAFVEGRVAELILHEGAVRHWGEAADARRVDAPWEDDSWYGDALWHAQNTSAKVRFCRHDDVLEQQEGVVATLRW